MTLTEIIQNIFYVVSLIGFGFLIWRSFADPQAKLDKKESALAEQLKYTQEMNERATSLAENHIHTVEEKVTMLDGRLNDIRVEIGKLATIIDERIPKMK